MGRPFASSSLQVLRDTIRTNGFRGLYDGCSALAVSNAAKGGVRFISFSQSHAATSKTRLGKANPGLAAVVSGLFAGVTESLLVVTPGEALKTHMIHSRSHASAVTVGVPQNSRNLVQVLAYILRVGGIRLLWNGLGPVLCKQGTNSAVRFATFESIRQKLSSSGAATGIGSSLIAEAASGVVTT